MIIYIKNMQCQRCVLMVIEILNLLKFEFLEVVVGEITLCNDLNEEQLLLLNTKLLSIGLEIYIGNDLIITEDIKHEIYEMLYEENETSTLIFSDRLAEKLGYSKNYLSTIFKKTTKTNIIKFINIERLRMIKEMLLTRNFTLTQIADRLHFCDSQYLCQFFKKYALCTTRFFLLNN